MASSRLFASALFLGLASLLLALLVAPLPAQAVSGRRLEGLPSFNFTGTKLQEISEKAKLKKLSGVPMNINGRKLLSVPLHLI